MADGAADRYLELATDIAGRYARLPAVAAVALGGSLATGAASADSDIDLYVFVMAPLAPAERARIVSDTTDPATIRNDFWGAGDEWRDAGTGIHVDAMLWDTRWIADQLDRVLERHEPSVGYSTSFWHTVLHARALYDREGWFRMLQERARRPYPEPLARAIIANNLPILGRTESALLHQIEKAVARGDLVSVNHRVAALLASVFDILFALNRVPHPGEKRLLDHAERLCARRPASLRADVEALLRAAGTGGDEVIPRAQALIEGLEAVL